MTEDENVSSETITLKVRDQTGDEMFFKVTLFFVKLTLFEVSYSLTQSQVKKTTKLTKIMDAYAQRRGIQASSLRFLLDGKRVNPDETPKMLELEDNDQLDVTMETVGGNLKTYR